jgi:replicative DNA helicase
VLLAQELLDADDFYDPAHKEIFAAMCHLANQSRRIDLVTVDEELSRRGALRA